MSHDDLIARLRDLSSVKNWNDADVQRFEAADALAAQAAEIARLTGELAAALHNADDAHQRCLEYKAERDAAVAELRQIRIDIASLHYVQSINHQNQPAAWHDAVDAALEAFDAALQPTQEKPDA